MRALQRLARISKAIQLMSQADFAEILKGTPERLETIAVLNNYSRPSPLPSPKSLYRCHDKPDMWMEDRHIGVVDRTKQAIDSEPRALEAFYSKWLRRPPDQEPLPMLVVAYDDVANLRHVFPNVRIAHFECYGDYFSWNNSKWGARAPVANDVVVSTLHDDELWKSCPIRSIRCEIVVAVYCLDNEAFHYLAMKAASRFWIGSDGLPGFWSKPGKRVDAAENPVTKVVVSCSDLNDYRDLKTYRLRPAGSGPLCEYEIHMVHEQISLALEVIPYLHDFGWVPEHVQLVLLEPPSPEEHAIGEGVVRPGTEWQYVLPIHASEVLRAIDAGLVTSGKMFLLDTKGNKYRTLRNDLRSDHVTKEECFDHDPVPESIVFYCNHGNSSSPFYAELFFRWVRERRPANRTRIYVLTGGMCALNDYAKSLGREDIFMA